MTVAYTYTSETRDLIIDALEAAAKHREWCASRYPRLDRLVDEAIAAMDKADAFDYEKESA